MPNILTFENSTFADLVQKAVSCAPTVGQAFEISAGIIIDYLAGDVTFRATNQELFYTEWTTPIGMDLGDPEFHWRISSFRIGQIAKVLPIGAGKTVTLQQQGSFLTVTSGAMRSNIPLMDSSTYQDWGVFDPDILSGTAGFAERIERVQWACAGGNEVPLNGIHFTGEVLVTTDRHKVAITPCEVQCDEPFTVPSTVVSQLVKANGGEDAKVGFLNGRLRVMPNQHSQIQVVTLSTAYPKVFSKLVRDHSHSFVVGKDDLLGMVKRGASLSSDRMPVIDMFIGDGKIACMSRSEDNSTVGDVLEIEGFAQHSRFTLGFSPKNFLAAIDHAPGSEVEVFYTPGENRKLWRIMSDGGYEAFLVPALSSGALRARQQEE